jgi:formylglycine-generating enzyme required for sulfatase activity
VSCCSPDRDAVDPVSAGSGTGSTDPAPTRPDPAGTDPNRGHPTRAGLAEVVWVPGGEFVMGDDSSWSYPADGEGPARRVRVSPFGIDATAVSNADFATFVDETGHVTDAERFEWSFVFAGFLPDGFPDTRGVVGAEWWRQVFGASWRHPEGPQSDVEGRLDHPVLHVSWTDAVAFATWAGKRLPTEAEWERAARAGSSTTFPWGDELEPGGHHRANVFQGTFPGENTAADGWAGACPVDAFEPNGFGLFNMIGNVWEWTADRWSAHRFDAYAGSGALRAGPAGAMASAVEEAGDAVIIDPTGPGFGDGRTMKGGSYLCHASYCRRYRPAARMSSTADSSAGNVGFRCAVDAP